VREARITCRASRYRIGDLDLTMRHGEVAYVPEADARASSELRCAERGGGVTVRYVERCKVAKRPPPPKKPLPPSVRMSRPNRDGMGQPRREADEPEVVGVTAEDIRQVVREEVRAALGGVSQPGMDPEQLRAILADALGSAPTINPGVGLPPAGPAQVAPDTSETDEPVFIPANIVDKDAKADITVESTETEADDLDAAAAALARVRPKAKKRKRRKEE
jgi:hypothetical protein